MEDFTDLQRLLRLKSYEIPPPDFMEDFLTELHQRQRAELLKRPLWRLAMDRFEGVLSDFQMPRYAYASACAVALMFAGVSANRILTSTPRNTGLMASANVQKSVSQGFHSPAPKVVVKSPRFDIYASRPTLSLAELDFDKPRPSNAGSVLSAKHPRYVLDAQPVSYEQPDSF